MVLPFDCVAIVSILSVAPSPLVSLVIVVVSRSALRTVTTLLSRPPFALVVVSVVVRLASPLSTVASTSVVS